MDPTEQTDDSSGSEKKRSGSTSKKHSSTVGKSAGKELKRKEKHRSSRSSSSASLAALEEKVTSLHQLITDLHKRADTQAAQVLGATFVGRLQQSLETTQQKLEKLRHDVESLPAATTTEDSDTVADPDELASLKSKVEELAAAVQTEVRKRSTTENITEAEKMVREANDKQTQNKLKALETSIKLLDERIAQVSSSSQSADATSTPASSSVASEKALSVLREEVEGKLAEIEADVATLKVYREKCIAEEVVHDSVIEAIRADIVSLKQEKNATPADVPLDGKAEETAARLDALEKRVLSAETSAQAQLKTFVDDLRAALSAEFEAKLSALSQENAILRQQLDALAKAAPVAPPAATPVVVSASKVDPAECTPPDAATMSRSEKQHKPEEHIGDATPSTSATLSASEATTLAASSAAVPNADQQAKESVSTASDVPAAASPAQVDEAEPIVVAEEDPALPDVFAAALSMLAARPSQVACSGLDISLTSEWRGVTAGGCFNHWTWRLNPQFRLSLSEPDTQVTITLRQHGDHKPHPIGFYLVQGDESPHSLITTGTVLAKSGFAQGAVNSFTTVLPDAPHPLYLIPCTFYPGKECAFTVAVVANKPVELSPSSAEHQREISSVASSWTAESAGGCRNNPTCLANPHIRLRLTEDTKVHLLLVQEGTQDHIGMYAIERTTRVSTRLVGFEGLFTKAVFASADDSWLSIEAKADRDYVILPCTFEPGNEAKFRLYAFADVGTPTLCELEEPPQLTVSGEWRNASAGGCMNYATCRNNPQYALTVNENTNVIVKLTQPSQNADVQSIGFYVVRPSEVFGDRRRLEFTREAMLAKGPFGRNLETSVRLQLPVSPHPYLVIPATFQQGVESSFRLTVYPESNEAGEFPKLTLQPVQEWHTASGASAWRGETAGGCLNYHTWRKNPQFALKAPPGTELLALLSQPKENLTSIGLYVTRSQWKSGVLPQQSLSANDLVAKAAFRKSPEVSCMWTVPDNDSESTRYALIPCAFRPEKEGEFELTIYSTQPCELVPAEQQSENLLATGEWKQGETAGGCINNGSWINNPHFVLATTKPTKVTLLLIQRPSEVDPTGAEPMGMYITRSDEYNRPIVTSPDDIVAKSEFQATQDLSMEFWLEPSERPLIVTPCTFHPDRELAFSLQVFTESDANECVLFMSASSILAADEDGDEGGVYSGEESGEIEYETDDDEEDVADSTTTEDATAVELPVAASSSTTTPTPTAAVPDLPSMDTPVAERDGDSAVSSVTTTAVVVGDTKPVGEDVSVSAEATPSEVTPSSTAVEKGDTSAEATTPPAVVMDSGASPASASATGTPPPPPPPPTSGVVRTSSLADQLKSTRLRKAKRVVRKKVEAKSGPAALLNQIRQGTALRNARERKLAAPPPKFHAFSFNIEKIVARRAAIEMSDDEDQKEEEWDDDDW